MNRYIRGGGGIVRKLRIIKFRWHVRAIPIGLGVEYIVGHISNRSFPNSPELA